MTRHKTENKELREEDFISKMDSLLLIFIEGVSGELEVLNYRGKVSQEDYICLQRYALGKLLFKLSKIKIVK